MRLVDVDMLTVVVESTSSLFEIIELSANRFAFEFVNSIPHNCWLGRVELDVTPEFIFAVEFCCCCCLIKESMSLIVAVVAAVPSVNIVWAWWWTTTEDGDDVWPELFVLVDSTCKESIDDDDSSTIPVLSFVASCIVWEFVLLLCSKCELLLEETNGENG